jgi:hypothetical protein
VPGSAMSRTPHARFGVSPTTELRAFQLSPRSHTSPTPVAIPTRTCAAGPASMAAVADTMSSPAIPGAAAVCSSRPGRGTPRDRPGRLRRHADRRLLSLLSRQPPAAARAEGARPILARTARRIVCEPYQAAFTRRPGAFRLTTDRELDQRAIIDQRRSLHRGYTAGTRQIVSASVTTGSTLLCSHCESKPS